jgi:hypothetical protein
MAALTDEQRRALQLLAGSPNGCTEAILIAHGFHLAMLGKLAFDGFQVHVFIPRPTSHSQN